MINLKAETRELIKAERRKMSDEDVLEKSIKASTLFVNSEIYKKSKCLMIYFPLGNETDTAEIARAAYGDKKKIVFPVTDETQCEIVPYAAEEDTRFIRGGFSVFEPKGTQAVDKLKIDTIIVPGIAFDKFGSRIGFGKGCYDRFLRDLPAVKVGFCYEFQLCDKIDADDFDVKMDFLITEEKIIRCI
jgi:5-formyltetrahydrofolate cyclo-ligase